MPCGLISTTTTLAIGFPLASFTRPVIVTVARDGLSIFSTGEVSCVDVEAGVGSAAEVGVGEAPGGASGLELGSGVASGDAVGDVEGSAVDDGVSGEAVGPGVAAAGTSGEGDEGDDGVGD